MVFVKRIPLSDEERAKLKLPHDVVFERSQGKKSWPDGRSDERLYALRVVDQKKHSYEQYAGDAQVREWLAQLGRYPLPPEPPVPKFVIKRSR
jgi:hypothetical protein